MRRARLPGPAKGLAIGLLGGSFNPAHAGHRHVAETAMRRLKLDAVWWVVARGNPLKATHGDFGTRLASASAMARGHRQRVTGLEAALGLTYTADTIRALKASAPQARFIWLMGGDNLAGFHRWEAWEDIARAVPIAIIARPGQRLSKATPFTQRFRDAQVPDTAATSLSARTAPAWVYLRGREIPLSSTALRGGR